MDQQWYTQAAVNRLQLIELGEAVYRRHIPRPSGDHESMVQYDRQRMLKEMLLDRIICTCVDTADAVRFILAALAVQTRPATPGSGPDENVSLASEEQQAIGLCAAVFRREAQTVAERWQEFRATLEQRPDSG